MAYKMTKRGSQDNEITYEFICDTLTDMNAIENKYRSIGTIAIVLEGESGSLEVYITDSKRQWLALNASVSNDSSSSGGLSVYICGQNEVSNGLPNISEPDETTIYLVSSGNTTGNLYEEYIYVNNGWEKFGAASIDLSNYVTNDSLSAYYQKPSTGIPATDLASGVIPDVSGFYTKPSGGIPAADIASGVIPSLTGYATETFVTTRIPTPPVADGTYILQVSVSSGTPTYSWVSLSSLSGVTF